MRLLYLIAFALLSAMPLCAEVVQITGVYGLQPGVVRVDLRFEAPFRPTFIIVPNCEAPTSAASVISVPAFVEDGRAAVDLRVQLSWLENNSFQRPCMVTSFSVQMWRVADVVATADSAQSFQMDVPLSHLHPKQFSYLPSGSFSAQLNRPQSERRHAGYPPRIIGIHAGSGRFAFAEVEELPGRGSLGLRGLVVFNNATETAQVEHEFGAGAEIFPGWGIDVDGQAVTKDGEDSNAGKHLFEYAGRVHPPVLSGDRSPLILPAPPLFNEATYAANALDNRGVARCPAAGGCLELIYNQYSNTIESMTYARLFVLDAGPIGNFGAPSIRDASARLEKGLQIKALSREKTKRLARQIPSLVSRRDLRGRGLSDQVLNASAVESIEGKPSRDFALVKASPEELMNEGQPPDEIPGFAKAGASCALNSANDSFTETLSPCGGWSVQGFRCPTITDRLPIDSLPISPVRGSTSTAARIKPDLMPYFAGRSNVFGTCVGHSSAQYMEALLNKYHDDLAVKRVIYVNGQPVTVPAPRIGLSVASSGWAWKTWTGTKAGDPDLDPAGTDYSGTNTLPFLLDAYWPGREPLWRAWSTQTSATGQEALAKCAANVWRSGFCLSLGGPPPGAYRNYSQMVRQFGGNPLSDPPWSLAQYHFNLKETQIGLGDRHQAILAVLNQIDSGLPVQLGYYTQANRSVDGHSFLSGASWYLPPELGTCSSSKMWAAFQPSGGHRVNIIGYALSGSRQSFDPYNSYFILMNNWGKNAGDNGRYFMNFAYFKMFATSLRYLRLDHACLSNVCAQKPGITIGLMSLWNLLHPPRPGTEMRRAYDQIMKEISPTLGGVPRSLAKRIKLRRGELANDYLKKAKR